MRISVKPKYADERSDFKRLKDLAKEKGLILEKIRKRKFLLSWNSPCGEISSECHSIDEIVDEIHSFSDQIAEYA